MKCPMCSTENEAGAKFCGGCGYNLQLQQPTHTQPDQTQPVPPQPVQTQPVVQPVYTAPIQPVVNRIPEEYTPIGAWMYFLWNIVFSIPLIGFIMLIVFSCGGTNNINLRNYARSHFCALLVAAILTILILVLTVALGVSLAPAIASY